MSRRVQAVVPGRPSPQPASPQAAPQQTRRARPIAAATARPDGAIIEASGSMDQLTPLQDEGLRDAPKQSPNLAFNAGGAPVMTVVDEEPSVEAPPPQRFKVLKDADVAINGQRTKLREGKVVDAANFDLEALRRYGVKLGPVEADL